MMEIQRNCGAAVVRLMQPQAVVRRTSGCRCHCMRSHTPLSTPYLREHTSDRWGVFESGYIIRVASASDISRPSRSARIPGNWNSTLAKRSGLGCGIKILSPLPELTRASPPRDVACRRIQAACLTNAPCQLLLNGGWDRYKYTSDGGHGKMQALSLTTYDAYGRHIQFVMEQAIGPPRTSEFRSLQLVNRSMTCMHALLLPLLVLAPPTSLELLLVPHTQLCCLCTAQSASVSLWGFGIVRIGPLASKGFAISDWRLAVGLAFFWASAVTLVISLKNAKLAYALQIPVLLTLHLIETILARPSVAALPPWWVTGSNKRMRLVLLISTITALARAAYVEANAEAIMARALAD